MDYGPKNIEMIPRRCVREMVVVALVSLPLGGASVAWVNWATSHDMPIDEAMSLAGDRLTADQETLVVSAIRRQAEACIRALRLRDPTSRDALNRIHELSKP